MEKRMKQAAFLATAITIFCVVLYMHTGVGIVLTLAITFGTTAYHFIMRLLVGFCVDRLLDNHVNYRRRWFQVSPAEQQLYRRMKVKNWKKKMPTYQPACFDRKLHTWDEIAQATCQAEIVHEVIILFSFLPLFAAFFFGALEVFMITSVLAACYDAMFVILQRYNRPRILRFIEKQEALTE